MISRSFSRILGVMLTMAAAPFASAQNSQPWQQPSQQSPSYDGYGTRGGGASDGYGQSGGGYGGQQGSAHPNDAYSPPGGSSQGYGAQGGGYGGGGNDAYSPSGQGQGYGTQSRSYSNNGYSNNGYGGGGPNGGYTDPGEPAGNGGGGYGQPYSAPPPDAYDRRDQGGPGPHESNTYNQNEIVAAGHGFFGAVSKGLASAVEYAFKSEGRPNGYILGEDAGGAFVVGLRYGEGTLFTKDAGDHKVYWQGPSLGYDAGAEGSKTMVLVYNLRDPGEIYNRFGGAEGSAYLVGGVSVQFQKYGDVTLGVIRSGVGLRLGANVGYLKYTRTPTWNPL
jgi:hypothetical protein